MIRDSEGKGFHRALTAKDCKLRTPALFQEHVLQTYWHSFQEQEGRTMRHEGTPPPPPQAWQRQKIAHLYILCNYTNVIHIYIYTVFIYLHIQKQKNGHTCSNVAEHISANQIWCLTIGQTNSARPQNANKPQSHLEPTPVNNSQCLAG